MGGWHFGISMLIYLLFNIFYLFIFFFFVVDELTFENVKGSGFDGGGCESPHALYEDFFVSFADRICNTIMPQIVGSFMDLQSVFFSIFNFKFKHSSLN